MCRLRRTAATLNHAGVQDPYILHFEPSPGPLSLRSDVIRSTNVLSSSVPRTVPSCSLQGAFFWDSHDSLLPHRALQTSIKSHFLSLQVVRERRALEASSAGDAEKVPLSTHLRAQGKLGQVCPLAPSSALSPSSAPPGVAWARACHALNPVGHSADAWRLG